MVHIGIHTCMSQMLNCAGLRLYEYEDFFTPSEINLAFNATSVEVYLKHEMINYVVHLC